VEEEMVYLMADRKYSVREQKLRHLWGARYNLQRYFHSGLIPLAGPHLLKFYNFQNSTISKRPSFNT
jgi:hypothetical protein